MLKHYNNKREIKQEPVEPVDAPRMYRSAKFQAPANAVDFF